MKSCPHILRYQIGCQSCLRFQSNTYYSDEDFLSPKNCLVAWLSVGSNVIRHLLRLAIEITVYLFGIFEKSELHRFL